MTASRSTWLDLDIEYRYRRARPTEPTARSDGDGRATITLTSSGAAFVVRICAAGQLAEFALTHARARVVVEL